MNPSITRVLTYGMGQTHVLPQSAYKTCATNWYPQTYFNHCVTVCLLLRRLCGRIARMQSPLHAPVVVDVQLTARLRVRIIPCSRGSTCRQRIFRNGRRHRVSQYIRFAENPLYRNDIIYFRRIQLDIARSQKVADSFTGICNRVGSIACSCLPTLNNFPLWRQQTSQSERQHLDQCRDLDGLHAAPWFLAVLVLHTLRIRVKGSCNVRRQAAVPQTPRQSLPHPV